MLEFIIVITKIGYKGYFLYSDQVLSVLLLVSFNIKPTNGKAGYEFTNNGVFRAVSVNSFPTSPTVVGRDFDFLILYLHP